MTPSEHEQLPTTESLIVSHLTVRKTIGLVAIISPILLVVFSMFLLDCQEVQDSVSHYYHTDAGGILVGALCVTAFLLFIYKGHSRIDNIVCDLGCLACLGVAFFPTSVDPGTTSSCIPMTLDQGVFNVLHGVSAIGQFVTLGFVPLFLFTRTHANEQPTPQKLFRNKIYRICGVTMWTCLVLIIIYILFLRESYPALHSLKPVFTLEAVALLAFGTSWLIKGKAFLRDKSPA